MADESAASANMQTSTRRKNNIFTVINTSLTADTYFSDRKTRANTFEFMHRKKLDYMFFAQRLIDTTFRSMKMD